MSRSTPSALRFDPARSGWRSASCPTRGPDPDRPAAPSSGLDDACIPSCPPATRGEGIGTGLAGHPDRRPPPPNTSPQHRAGAGQTCRTPNGMPRTSVRVAGLGRPAVGASLGRQVVLKVRRPLPPASDEPLTGPRVSPRPRTRRVRLAAVGPPDLGCTDAVVGRSGVPRLGDGPCDRVGLRTPFHMRRRKPAAGIRGAADWRRHGVGRPGR
jgi:hypothetical protein